MPWQKDTPSFRDALRDIRTIPRAILCNPNTKVEMNFDAFRRQSENRPPSPPVVAHTPPPRHSPIRPSWSRHGWPPSVPRQQHQPALWNLPPAFEGLFQNDASATGPKTLTKKERRRLRRKNRENKNGRPMTPEEAEKRKKRRQRRKARRERLAKMSPPERIAWKARRRERRALRRKQRLQQQPGGAHQQGRNRTAGSHF